MVIWNHRNNIIFCNHKCNPVYIIELAKNTFYSRIMYNITITLNNIEDVASSKVKMEDIHIRLSMGILLQLNGLKWNTDASKIEARHTT